MVNVMLNPKMSREVRERTESERICEGDGHCGSTTRIAVYMMYKVFNLKIDVTYIVENV